MEAVSSQMVAATKPLEAIVNGDSPPPKRTVDGVEQTYPPNEHQLKFNTYKCVKTLMEAIKKRFGGNKESKKTQKTLLNQQYENLMDQVQKD
ncbi:hypothetical protein Tco_0349250 [Tanacetum coccineum]